MDDIFAVFDDSLLITKLLNLLNKLLSNIQFVWKTKKIIELLNERKCCDEIAAMVFNTKSCITATRNCRVAVKV